MAFLIKLRMLWTKTLQQLFSVNHLLHFPNSSHLFHISSGLVNFSGSIIFLIALKYLKRKWILMSSAFVMGTSLALLGELGFYFFYSMFHRPISESVFNLIKIDIISMNHFRLLPTEPGECRQIMGIFDMSPDLYVFCPNWTLFNSIHVHCGNVST